MANERENRIVAWVTMIGPPGNASFQWKGQGIQSVTRDGVGLFSVLLADGLETRDTAIFLTPSGGEAQPGTADPIQSCVQRLAGDQVAQCVFSLGDDSTTRVDPQGFSLEVVQGNVELPDQAVL